MDCVIFGIGGSYLHDVAESLFRLGWSIAAYVTNVPDAPADPDLDPIVDVSEVDDRLRGLPAVVAVATPSSRRQAVASAREAGFRTFPAVVDPTSVLARSVSLGTGALVNALTVIAPRTRIEAFGTVNRGCSIGHDAVVGSYTFLGPSVVISGGVHIGDQAFLGAGAIVRPEITIGPGATVGAGAVVVKDVAADTVVVGNPAHPLDR